MIDRGLFIVFEGGDGTGKSSQIDALARSFDLSSVAYMRTHEPGEGLVGAQIRSLLLTPPQGVDLDDRCEALLYAADKAQHVKTCIEPALNRGVTVLCDRYVDSMIAYQVAGRQGDRDEIVRLAQWSSYGRLPDLTILLDADPEIAVGPKKNKDRVESADLNFHHRVREEFLSLACKDPERYLVVQALTSLPAIAARIRQRVEQMMGISLVEPELDNPRPRNLSF